MQEWIPEDWVKKEEEHERINPIQSPLQICTQSSSDAKKEAFEDQRMARKSRHMGP